MQYNNNWGKTGKSIEKRKSSLPAKDPLKRGPFTPTPAFIKFVETNIINRKTANARPKSTYRHGIRVYFAECDPFLVIEIAKMAEKTFAKHTAAHSRLDKGYFDMAFASNADADEAAATPLIVSNRHVPTVRTRYAKDTNLFIGFEDLPCTMDRANIINFLR